MLRSIELHELPKLENLIREFVSSSKSFVGEFNLDAFLQFWTNIYNFNMGIIFALIDDNEEIYGALGCVRIPDPFTGIMCSNEFFWYVLEGRRGEGMLLLNEYERWAKWSGCKYIRMASLFDSLPDKINSIYIQRGYVQIETAYQMEI
jgi:hypothetical protein